MRRADRMIELVAQMKATQLVRAEDLADRLEVSVRTVYRDIASLQAQGLPIEGAAGMGYMLRGEVDLPPMTFDHDELEALALGLAYVEQVGDPALMSAARAARGKIDAAWAGQPTPPVSQRRMRSAQRGDHRAPMFTSVLRGALRARNVVEFRYRDAEGSLSRREVLPLALSAFSDGWLLIAWCRLRDDFRVFRLDRMSVVQPTGETFADQPGMDLASYLSVRGPQSLARSPAWIG